MLHYDCQTVMVPYYVDCYHHTEEGHVCPECDFFIYDKIKKTRNKTHSRKREAPKKVRDNRSIKPQNLNQLPQTIHT